MKTLILSCNTGEGHNACAKAIQQYYEEQGEQCIIEDALAFLSEEISKLISKGHVLMYRRFSPLFGWGYEYAKNHRDSLDEDSRIYHFFSRGTDALYSYIREYGFTSVICTHPFAAIMVTVLRRERELQISSAFVATDYSCCPGAECSEMDVYFIPDRILSDEFIQCGIPENKLCPSGIPIRQEFYTRVSREKAKVRFGIRPENRHIVMACGSMGCGPMEIMSKKIVPRMGEHTELTIVCGTNERLKSSMEKLHGENPRVHVQGFVEDMPGLLDSTDVYVTKPGGLSVSEAMAKGSFMVLINAVGGCESYNLLHLLRKGNAVTGDNVEELTGACLEAVEQKRQPAALCTENAAQIIYETMKEKDVQNEETKQPSACT